VSQRCGKKNYHEMNDNIKLGCRVFDKHFGVGRIIEIGVEPWPYAVRFDKKTDGLHDCSGITEDGHGAFYSDREVVKMKSREVTADTECITLRVIPVND
jgi:hypothetical protein